MDNRRSEQFTPASLWGKGRPWRRLGWLGGLGAVLLSGCSSLGYYGQAALGQWEVWSKQQAVESLLQDPTLDPLLKQRLILAQAMLRFAEGAMGRTPKGKYGSYADLGRPYVVRVVYAAPEFSLSPVTWCFPVAGCLVYRGYFRPEAADAFAEGLRAQGLDVYVGGVPAYSTLGWFDDPLLNTFLHWPEERLVGLIFHELAHGRLYIADDAAFNESFAEVVAGIGARRWLTRRDPGEKLDALARFEAHKRLHRRFTRFVQGLMEDLSRLYREELPLEERRAARLRRLSEAPEAWRRLAGASAAGDSPESAEIHRYARWLGEGLNNAKLLSVSTYARWVPAFEALYREQGEEMGAFFAAAEALGALPPAEREEALRRLSMEGAR
ncbi:MAG: aminopeptidase [Magnetococcales bacterium]|nr:aminopeptidase [Magnetococcales bacterium]